MSQKSNSRPIEKKQATASKCTGYEAKGLPAAGKHAYLRVAESIKLRILSGQLKPGDRLPSENELAKEQGVGRTTAREALRLLASARLIETRRGVQGGAFVTHPTSDDLDDLMMTALSLMTMNGELGDDELAEATHYTMPTVAEIGTLRGSDEELARLVELAAFLSRTANDDEWVKVGMEFNALVIEMTRNRVLAMFIKPIAWIAPTRFKELRQVPGWYENTAAHYEELANAMQRREPDAAFKAMLGLQQCYMPFRNFPVKGPSAVLEAETALEQEPIN